MFKSKSLCIILTLLSLLSRSFLSPMNGFDEDLDLPDNEAMDIDSDLGFEGLAVEDSEVVRVIGRKRGLHSATEAEGKPGIKTQKSDCGSSSHVLRAFSFFSTYPSFKSFHCGYCDREFGIERTLFELINMPLIPEGFRYYPKMFDLQMIQRLFHYAVRSETSLALNNMIKLGIPFNLHPMKDNLSALAVGALCANFQVLNTLTNSGLTFSPYISEYDMLKYSLMGLRNPEACESP